MVISSILYICHRVVHGGSYSRPVLIDQDAYNHIAALSALAPLLNASALDVICACLESMPHAKSIAFFNTVFHNSIPKHISAYAIDQSIATERGLCKYGFHGLSYAYILRSISTHLSRPASFLNVIALLRLWHLRLRDPRRAPARHLDEAHPTQRPPRRNTRGGRGSCACISLFHYTKELREAVVERVQCLGYAGIDKGRNERVGRGREEGESVVDIGVQGSGKRVLVCWTHEQLEMARTCALDEEFRK
ncbi:hypothetical protein DXG01_014891 [Tephrocybe rancida]|nr:hypothetical protein DXG01_014891 [Tephrocybe rancida]